MDFRSRRGIGIVLVAVVATTVGGGLAGPAPVAAAAPTMTPTVVQGGSNQLSFTWDLAFLPSGEMLVTERAGRVRVYASGAVGAPLLRTVTIPSVRAEGEAGLMGIAVDLAFASNRYVYVCASRQISGEWLNQVLRYTVTISGSWTSGVVILGAQNPSGSAGEMDANTIHNGCAVEMDRFGKVWVTMGDANNAISAQNPNDLNGKILRIHRDGSIPSDNPIMPGASARTAIFSMGHRNPQGIAFQPVTNRVYAAEHGPSTDDEINRILGGANYGWPCFTGDSTPGPGGAGCNPDPAAYSGAVWESNSPTLASSGLTFADGTPWADYDGSLFVAQLKESDLRRHVLSADGTTTTGAALGEVFFDGTWGRLRAVVRGPAGQLFLTTSNGGNDRVIRIAVATPSVVRIAGSDRYATAAAISAAHFTPGVPVAYVATGLNFPDALAGGAAAAHDHGPLLLVTQNSIPSATAAELSRLHPGKIRVLGGPGAVSNAVASALDAYTTGPVQRLSGADRYATAAAVSAATFSPGVAAVFIATGANCPDALSAGGAAGHFGGPILLTTANQLPAPIQTELSRLDPQQVFILGGTAVISSGVASTVNALTDGPVTRLAGANRYGTSAAVSAATWSRSNIVYVATGENFPDGLAGGAAAGSADKPLLIVEAGAVPTVIGQDIIRLHPSQIIIFGGTGAVSAAVQAKLLSILAAP
jgi:glucose/arabinose dehydrogenase/putative cell wall-binding protein